MKVLSEPVTEVNVLRSLCLEIEDAPHIALDTEFTRYRTYRPKFELLQIATDTILFCVDASCALDWSPLRRVLNAPAATAVIHSAVQDIEVLQQFELVPRRIVDSQVAAQICGATKISYQDLVKQHMNVSLPKDLTRSKWSRRPFSSQQIRYALDDVRYLLPLFRKLESELERLQRLAWFEEECSRLHKVASISSAADSAWKSFCAGSTLSPRDQLIAKNLLIWRETRAKMIDWPRQWVLSDQKIVNLARLKPATIDETARHIGLKRRPIPHWLSGVQSILRSRPNQVPDVIWQSSRPLTKTEKKLTNQILDRVRQTARQHGVAESLLCTREEAVNSARGSRNSRMFSGWRREILGDLVDSLLNELQ